MQDELLLKCVGENGREWKRIQDEHYPCRSRNDLKNRYVGFNMIMSAAVHKLSPDGSYTILTRRSKIGSRVAIPSSPAEKEVAGRNAIDLMDDDDNSTEDHRLGSPSGEVSNPVVDRAIERCHNFFGIRLGGEESNIVDVSVDSTGDSWLETMCPSSQGQAGLASAAVADFGLPQDGFFDSLSPAPALTSFATSSCCSSPSPETDSVESVDELQTMDSSHCNGSEPLPIINLPQVPCSPALWPNRQMGEGPVEGSEGTGWMTDLQGSQHPGRRSKVALVVEACDGDMLDRLLAVARTATGHAKLEIEYAS